MRVPAALLMLAGLAAALPAAEDGGQALAWSKLSLGARSAALGQAVGALAGDVGAALVNPALLASLERPALGSQAALLPDGRQLHYLGFARPFTPGSAWSLGADYAQYYGDQAIERRRGNTPEPDGLFGESGSSLRLGVAAWILERRVALGLGAKLYSQQLGDASAMGYGADLGLLWRARPWLDLGLAVRDPVGQLTWNTSHAETADWALRAGLAAALPGGRWRLLLDGEAGGARAFRPRAGLEAWAWPARLALRAGFDGAQWSTGFGLQQPFGDTLARLDYALASDAIGLGWFQHRVSLGLSLPF